MLKQIIALILVSLGMIFAMPYAQHAVQWILNAHDWVLQILSDVFSMGEAGNLAKEFIALLSIPVFVGLIPSLIYWMTRRHWFPYFIHIVWVVWFVEVGALAITYRVAVTALTAMSAAPVAQ